MAVSLDLTEKNSIPKVQPLNVQQRAATSPPSSILSSSQKERRHEGRAPSHQENALSMIDAYISNHVDSIDHV